MTFKHTPISSQGTFIHGASESSPTGRVDAGMNNEVIKIAQQPIFKYDANSAIAAQSPA